jgi:hypothetical protein
MLVRGDTGISNVEREVQGEAAGDVGAEGPNLELGTGIGRVLVSVKSGCTLPDRRGGGEAKPAPLGPYLCLSFSSSLSDSTVACLVSCLCVRAVRSAS